MILYHGSLERKQIIARKLYLRFWQCQAHLRQQGVGKILRFILKRITTIVVLG